MLITSIITSSFSGEIPQTKGKDAMTNYNPRGFFTIRDPRGCAIFVLSAVIVFWLGVLIGFVVGRV
jgi:hypothetical protein